MPRVSQFAKKRGLQKEEHPAQSKKETKLILGDVIEKLAESHSNVDRVVERNEAFPKACRIDRSVSLNTTKYFKAFVPSHTFQKLQNNDGTKSLFALSHAKRSNSLTATKVSRASFGDTSSILMDAKSIHEENVQLLNAMDETEILAERQQLLDTIGKDFHSEFRYIN